jgi:hypothetical protein
MMLRTWAISLLLISCLAAVAQDKSKVTKAQTRALDAASATPFLTKKGGDAVKRVIAGGDEHKADEKAFAPADAKGAPPMSPNFAQPQMQGPQMPAPVAPAPIPPFEWRLIGISYGKKQGMALFQSTGKSLTVSSGGTLDPDTKIVSISHKTVVLVYHGKRLELTPW